MSMTPVPDWKQIREKAGPYPPQAYQFVREGLAHTVKMVHGDAEGLPTETEDDRRHISGQQLCLGLKDYAQRQYGLLARTVLSSWGVHKTEDFGRIVFAMVEAGWMRKQDQDSIEDFENVFDFDDTFGTLRAGSAH
ncbi:MAG: hypothetical protein HEQ23_07245 [Tepidisphaera sp.]